MIRHALIFSLWIIAIMRAEHLIANATSATANAATGMFERLHGACALWNAGYSRLLPIWRLGGVAMM
jgi:hypothetical protein